MSERPSNEQVRGWVAAIIAKIDAAGPESEPQRVNPLVGDGRKTYLSEAQIESAKQQALALRALDEDVPPEPEVA